MLGSVRGFRLPRTPLAILVGLSLVPSFANRSVAETVVQATASDDKAPAQAASDTVQAGRDQRIGDFPRFLRPARR